MKPENQSGEEISLVKLIKEYFTKEEIITTRTYTVGDPRFGLTDLYGRKIGEARVMSSVPVRTGRYRRADIAYTAQELLIAGGLL